jgi:DNA processing protein
MADPPSEVFASGNLVALDGPAMAIVGTRKASVRGLAIARALGADLARLGWTVVSGLALGIDAAAHKGALDAGGQTVAVMATGIDRIYPRAHGDLRCQIEKNGCCITEYSLGSSPRKFHFPQRNRLIAALCQGVIVVEAPLKSGAMLTAYRALDYDREVFAVPGPIDQETSKGCHHLLRQGAHVLENAEDIIRVFGKPEGIKLVWEQANAPADGLALPQAGSAARWIYDRLNLEGVRRDDLRSLWGGNEGGWTEGLLALELAGLIQWLPGSRIARKFWHS